jgi:hypothetical protein
MLNLEREPEFDGLPLPIGLSGRGLAVRDVLGRDDVEQLGERRGDIRQDGFGADLNPGGSSGRGEIGELRLVQDEPLLPEHSADPVANLQGRGAGEPLQRSDTAQSP